MPISSHKINLATILLDAMEESEATENGSFGGFTCPTAAIFATQGRPRIGHFLVGSADRHTGLLGGLQMPPRDPQAVPWSYPTWI